LDGKNSALSDLSERFQSLMIEKDNWIELANKTQLALDTTSAKLKDVDGKLKNALEELLATTASRISV
jgi:hypothetical protein